MDNVRGMDSRRRLEVAEGVRRDAERSLALMRGEGRGEGGDDHDGEAAVNGEAMPPSDSGAYVLSLRDVRRIKDTMAAMVARTPVMGVAEVVSLTHVAQLLIEGFKVVDEAALIRRDAGPLSPEQRADIETLISEALDRRDERDARGG